MHEKEKGSQNVRYYNEPIIFHRPHSPATSFSFKNPRENIQIFATLDSIQYFIFKIFLPKIVAQLQRRGYPSLNMKAAQKKTQQKSVAGSSPEKRMEKPRNYIYIWKTMKEPRGSREGSLNWVYFFQSFSTFFAALPESTLWLRIRN